MSRSQQPRRTSRVRPQWGALIAALLSSCVGVGLLVALVLPPLQSALQTRVADGRQHFEVGAAIVTPQAGWSVRPLDDESVLISSPDRLLTVTVEAVTAGDAAEVAERHLATVLENEAAGDETPVAGGLAEPLVEMLANGIEVRHVTSEARVAAVLELPGEPVLLVAEVPDGVKIADYRLAFAELLLAVEPA